jgi:hypothetical protein
VLKDDQQAFRNDVRMILQAADRAECDDLLKRLQQRWNAKSPKAVAYVEEHLEVPTPFHGGPRVHRPFGPADKLSTPLALGWRPLRNRTIIRSSFAAAVSVGLRPPCRRLPYEMPTETNLQKVLYAIQLGKISKKKDLSFFIET